MKSAVTEAYSLKFDPQTKVLSIGGEMVMDTVPPMLKQAKQLLNDADKIEVDLQQVTRSDSSGLALLIDLMRHANGSVKEVRFRNMPKQMLAIANASGLEEFLPLGD